VTTNVSSKQTKEHSVRLRVTDEELRWLRQEADDQERTISSLLRVALRHYIETRP
jgi:hypothetical protein